jgi:hypothetical protein
VGVCDFPWSEYRSNCYLFISDPSGSIDSDSASNSCNGLASHLALIRNAKEQAFVNKLSETNFGRLRHFCSLIEVSLSKVPESTIYPVFIGLQRMDNGVWIWNNGENLIDFSNWMPDNPNPGSATKCGVMNSAGIFKGEWVSVSCDAKVTTNYICQKAAGKWLFVLVFVPLFP